MFWTRLFSGIILVALAIGFIWMGGYTLGICLLIISVIGLYEYNRANGLLSTGFDIISYLYAVFVYASLMFFKDNYVLLILIFAFMIHMCLYVFSYPKYNIEIISKSIFGIIYVPTMFSFILLTRNLDLGVFLVWIIFLSSWGCDTFAYCVGMLIGKHKMSPKLSPKKSIEGAIGGLVGTFILTFLFLYIFKNKTDFNTQKIILVSLLSIIAAFISMIGDLTASAIKRNNDIKDYGRLIPGHGGILDRFDSVIITAPIIYVATLFV